MWSARVSCFLFGVVSFCSPEVTFSLGCISTQDDLLDLYSVESSIYINKNVNVRLLKILNLRKFFTDCFEILTQHCIRIRACFYVPTVTFWPKGRNIWRNMYVPAWPLPGNGNMTHILGNQQCWIVDG
jgi:hypothetical protein